MPTPRQTFIRVRQTINLEWMWELVTADGHVASTSETFAERSACEASAKLEGLPITGLTRVKKAPKSAF
jgi:hypothetical protein